MFARFATIVAVALTLANSNEAGAKGITYNCDTAANRFSELSLPAAPAFAVSGRLQLINMAKSKQYAPLARLVVSNAAAQLGPSSEGWAGFAFFNMPGSKGLPTGLLESTVLAKGGANRDRTLGVASAKNIAFTLIFTGEEVRMNVDGREAVMPFKAERPIVRIVCSTGEFLFYDMEIVPTQL